MVPDRKGPPMTDAHVSLQDFRRHLRRHLPGGPDGGGAPWLDGLVMEHLPSGNVLRITFPHIYFARWFAPHETDFSAAVNAAWPDDVAPRLEYVLHGQPLPWRPAPQAAPFRIPDILFLHAGGSGDDAPLPGGARNAFPLALARAVVLREPGHSPFLLHGEKGTGKSHLLHHMAAALARQGLRVILAPAARFFRHCPPGEQTALLFWQQADALFLDDIQALDGQPRAQRLLAALLVHRPDAAPAVLALEGGPHMLGTWEPGPAASVRRLLSAELTPPDMEARMRYLQQCCRENALDLPREHLRLMARRAAHFRGLRSLLLRVKAAWGEGAAARPSLDDLERLARTGPVQACHAGHEQILAEAARCCDAAPADITGTGRHARLVMARQAAMYVCRRHLGLSYPELGRAFGGRDHSTVIHAVKKIGKMLESNKDVQRLVARLEKCAHQEQPDSPSGNGLFRT